MSSRVLGMGKLRISISFSSDVDALRSSSPSVLVLEEAFESLNSCQQAVQCVANALIGSPQLGHLWMNPSQDSFSDSGLRASPTALCVAAKALPQFEQYFEVGAFLVPQFVQYDIAFLTQCL